jgi:site-specific DNA-adenine methylase
MCECKSMCSNITVPSGTGKHAEVNEHTLSTSYSDSNIVNIGIKLIGDGADDLCSRLNNSYDIGYIDPPYVHITNLDD